MGHYTWVNTVTFSLDHVPQRTYEKIKSYMDKNHSKPIEEFIDLLPLENEERLAAMRKKIHNMNSISDKLIYLSTIAAVEITMNNPKKQYEWRYPGVLLVAHFYKNIKWLYNRKRPIYIRVSVIEYDFEPEINVPVRIW